MEENRREEECPEVSEAVAEKEAKAAGAATETEAAETVKEAGEAEQKTTQKEIIGFDIKTGEKDMTNFVLYHNYRCASGILGLVLSVAALIYLIIGFKTMDNIMRLALVFIGLLFTVVNPVMLSYKAKRQVRTNEGFKIPIHYGMTASYLTLTQDDQWVQVPWKNIYKVVDTGWSLVVYVSRMRAYVWPKNQLGTQLNDVLDLLRKKVVPGRVRINIKK